MRALLVSPKQADHIWDKHHVTVEEVYETCEAAHLVTTARDGGSMVFGRSMSGRYLVLFLYPRGTHRFTLATARDATFTERRRMQRRRAIDLFQWEDDDAGAE